LFLAEGAKVGFIDRNAELGAALAAELNIPFAQADVADAAQVS
jgi:NAD(P)-dependent dehydrogenase (short-subunit alcohol dehydrogenase family)